MVEVKTGPFICCCWAKCILGSQSGGIAPDCAAKAREPICGGKCHRVTPPCISASSSLWLVPHRALQLQLFLCVYICFSSFSSLSVSARVPLSNPSSRPSCCLSNQSLLTAFDLPRQPSKRYPLSPACFVSASFCFFTYTSFFFLASHHWASAKLSQLAAFYSVALSLTLVHSPVSSRVSSLALLLRQPVDILFVCL